jgi:hypothetical protein
MDIRIGKTGTEVASLQYRLTRRLANMDMNCVRKKGWIDIQGKVDRHRVVCAWYLTDPFSRDTRPAGL